MTAAQEICLIRRSEATSNHADWLGLMRDGMETLLQEPRLLAELIWGEAARQAARNECPRRCGTSFEAFKIFEELGVSM